MSVFSNKKGKGDVRNGGVLRSPKRLVHDGQKET